MKKWCEFCICTGQDRLSIIKLKSSHDLINNINKEKGYTCRYELTLLTGNPTLYS